MKITGLQRGGPKAVGRRILFRVLLTPQEIAGDRLCLVHIFQANLVGLMSPPKLAFYMVCSVYLISTSTSPLPQKFVEGRTLTWDLRN